MNTLYGRSAPVDIPASNRPLFESPLPAGRKITAGFTYLQRISKAASYDVWFPKELTAELDFLKSCGLPITDAHFPAEWAAVRQFELLQEAGNHKIYDLDPTYLTRAMLDLSRSMRAGGYRVTVATIGTYEEASVKDELEILDKRLQEEISQMIHMLYLDQLSEDINTETDAFLASQKWDYKKELPHVCMVLGSGELFQPPPDDSGDEFGNKRWSNPAKWQARKCRQGKRFFDILAKLPSKHIVHDTAVGLQLPELNGRNQWNYFAAPDETLGAFNRVLEALFDKFDGISMSRLHERLDAHSEIKPSTIQMRGYGDHLNEAGAAFYEKAALVYT